MSNINIAEKSAVIEEAEKSVVDAVRVAADARLAASEAINNFSTPVNVAVDYILAAENAASFAGYATAKASALRSADDADRLLKFMTDVRYFYLGYHNHKELSGWAALVFNLTLQALITTIITRREIQLLLSSKDRLAIAVGLVLLWAIISFYVHSQFKLRGIAARLNAAAFILSKSLLEGYSIDTCILANSVRGHTALYGRLKQRQSIRWHRVTKLLTTKVQSTLKHLHKRSPDLAEGFSIPETHSQTVLPDYLNYIATQVPRNLAAERLNRCVFSLITLTTVAQIILLYAARSIADPK